MRREVLRAKKNVELKEHMEMVLSLLHDYVNRYGEIKTFDLLHDIMIESKPFIEEYLDKRKKSKANYDKDQARKSLAGNIFQDLVLYLLILNIERKNLPEDLIVLKTKTHKVVDEYATIKIGDEEQKPDLDLVVFSEEEEKPIVIFSCKTSLRERAGQTYKWKLLIDISKYCPELVKKYKVEYPERRKVLTGFITPNFYNEIMKPQQRGILEFFDFTYIAKEVEPRPPVKRLSSIVEDLNSIFG